MGKKTMVASAALLLAGMTLLFSTCQREGDDDATGLWGAWTSALDEAKLFLRL